MSGHLINDLYEVRASDMHIFKTTPLVRATDPHTSEVAAQRAERKRSETEILILAILSDHPMGLTTYEMAATGRIEFDVCEKKMAVMERKGVVWRIWEGFSKSGRAIYESRDNHKGNPCNVWRKK